MRLHASSIEKSCEPTRPALGGRPARAALALALVALALTGQAAGPGGIDGLRAVIEAKARAAYPDAADVRVALAGGAAQLALPPCPSAWAVDLQGQRPLGNVALRATCPGSAASMRLAVHIEVDVPMLVATVGIPPGTEITPEMLALRPTPLRPNVEVVTDAGALLGQRVRSPLRAGQPVTAHDLEAAWLVKSGDQVSLEAGDEDFTVSVEAQALGNGRHGDQVRVKNISSGRVVVAWVVERGRVATHLPRRADAPDGAPTVTPADRARRAKVAAVPADTLTGGSAFAERGSAGHEQ